MKKNIVLLISVLFILSGCSTKEMEENKDILYKCDVESFNYNVRKDMMFKREYSTEYVSSATFMIDLKEDNSCYSSYKIKYMKGQEENYTSTTCQWQGIDYGVAVNLTYKNFYKECEDCSVTEDETEERFSGRYLEKGKFLSINNYLYENVDYTMLKDQNIDIFYYDKENDRAYTEEGFPVFNTDEQYRRENKINLNNYKIIDNSIYRNMNNE